MTIDPANCTLLELCLLRTGKPLKAARVAAFIVAWGVARNRLDGELTVQRYAEFWKQPVRTAFREQAEFREVFGGLETPDALIDHMEREAGTAISPTADLSVFA